jgi:hypothetical protein
MNIFYVNYLGNFYFSITNSRDILLTPIRKYDTIQEVILWSSSFCSSWTNVEIIYNIDAFKKERNYV